MSQQKVDQYKKEKANRQQIMKKQKRIRGLRIFLVVAGLAALVAWFSVSVARSRIASREPVSTVIDSASVDGYLDALDAYTAE